jgi:hypothetical protein
MRHSILRSIALLTLSAFALGQTPAQTIDSPQVNAELLRHYQALVRIDTTDPPGNETKAVEYIRQVLRLKEFLSSSPPRTPRVRISSRASRAMDRSGPFCCWATPTP